MASYAAVLSLFHTLNHIKNHPYPPISLDQSQVDSLTQKLAYFQDFLELYSGEEDSKLESRIATAAYAAEDVIESHIVDQIHAGSTSHVKNVRSVDLHQGLERVIVDMDLIKGEAMENIQEKIIRAQDHDLHTNSSVSTAWVGPASTWQSSIKPVFDDGVINEMLDKLTGQQSDLQIISIVGMGGIGKTTFARNIYGKPFIVEHFDIRAWVTISQEYSRGKILQVLCQAVKGSINGLSEMSEDELGLTLYQHLYGRRYLIVMDDIWSVGAWDKVKSFFPDKNGSRIMLTTRLSNLALEIGCSHIFRMQFLDEDKSWVLLCEIVFGKLGCPFELENVGKEISRKCRGLPLSLAVTGGILRKSNMTQAYWKHILENLSLLINLEDDEYILRILRTSYKELPMHLKPCFLYMGIFPEDNEIRTSMLIKLWISEGILRPVDDKSLEDVAKEYLKELIDRNLVLVPVLRWNGEAKVCKFHDLLRDLCLRESQKQKLFCVLNWQQKHHIPQGINMERRVCINHDKANKEYFPEFLHAIDTASLTRSLLYTVCGYCIEDSPSLRFRLLRVYSPVDGCNSFVTRFENAIFKQVNLRYLCLRLNIEYAASRLLSLCSLVWSLQTLKVDVENLRSFKPVIASEIWEMPLLRHVTFNEFVLSDPPNGEGIFVLKNLQTLSGVIDFKFSEEVVTKIPNVKKLKVEYRNVGYNEKEELATFCLNNLDRLQKLESFGVVFTFPCDLEIMRSNLVRFPHSLKKLSLNGTNLKWEELMTRIGSLPLLQYLRLRENACKGPKWETVEGQFCRLRFLHIGECFDLIYWDTDSDHFPCLEKLFLQHLPKLQEIPSSIGDITTLKSIRLERCNRSTEASAISIKEEQEENGNEDLQLHIIESLKRQKAYWNLVELATGPQSNWE